MMVTCDSNDKFSLVFPNDTCWNGSCNKTTQTGLENSANVRTARLNFQNIAISIVQWLYVHYTKYIDKRLTDGYRRQFQA